MKFNSSNDNGNNDHVEKVEPQFEVLDAPRTQGEQAQQEQTKSQRREEYHQAGARTSSHNPILDFVKNLGETAEYLWGHYLDWVIHVSWGKMFLACLLVLIAGSCLFLHTLANWFVFGSLLLKCFIGKEDRQAHQTANDQAQSKEN